MFRISELICLDQIKYMYIIDVNFLPYFFLLFNLYLQCCAFNLTVLFHVYAKYNINTKIHVA